MSKERPILFSGPMVRAILEGRKTQTRRAVKPQTAILTDEMARSLSVQPPKAENQPVIPCPYGEVGDRLWVRETHGFLSYDDTPKTSVIYAATPHLLESDGKTPSKEKIAASDLDGERWRPSIHMPRWASRITLEIISVRVERLQDITEDDAKSEGVRWDGEHWRGGIHPIKGTEKCWGTAKDAYEALWESINGPKSWSANPWVWVVEFKRVEA